MLPEELQTFGICQSRRDTFRSCLSHFKLPMNSSISREILDYSRAVFREINGDLSTDLCRGAELCNSLKVEQLVKIQSIWDELERKTADVFL